MNHRFTRFLLLTILNLPLPGFSQCEFNNWYNGYKSGEFLTDYILFYIQF